MLFNQLTFGLFMFPVISFMAVLLLMNVVLPRLGIGGQSDKKPQSL